MSFDELQTRLKRIFSAISDTLVLDFQDYKRGTGSDERVVFLFHELPGRRPTTEDVHNAAFSAIANVASLKDNLKKWAARNGKDVARVEAFVKTSPNLQLVIDLWNGDKHGYPLTFSHSGRNPQVVELRTVLSLSTGTTPHSGAAISFGPSGLQVELTGSGSGGLAITGSVVDASGAHLGDIEDVLRKALEEWTVLLAEFGVVVPASG